MIQGYVIRYRKAASKSNFKKKNIRAIDGTETRITQLEVYTRYEIMVQACTKQGCGPNSSLMINRTEEGGKCLLLQYLKYRNVAEIACQATGCIEEFRPGLKSQPI